MVSFLSTILFNISKVDVSTYVYVKTIDLFLVVEFFVLFNFLTFCTFYFFFFSLQILIIYLFHFECRKYNIAQLIIKEEI